MWLEISPPINIDTPVSGVDPGEHTLTIEIVLRCLFRDQDCLEGGNLPPKISAPLEGVLINPRGFAVGISIAPPPEYFLTPVYLSEVVQTPNSDKISTQCGCTSGTDLSPTTTIAN